MPDKQRCWPGYEPVPGKPEHSEGSCRPKAEPKLKPAEQKFRAKRRKQLDEWKAEHKGSRPQAAQHLSGPTKPTAKRGPQKAAAKKKSSTKKNSTKRTSAPKAS